MNFSLHQNMNSILNHGFQLVTRYKTTILKEWDQIVIHLHQRQEPSFDVLGTMVHLFTNYLFTCGHNNVEALFHDIQTAGNQFNQPMPPRHAIFIMTLLENAAHKAVKSGIDHSYQDHQAIQYLFSQLSELMFRNPKQHWKDAVILFNEWVMSSGNFNEAIQNITSGFTHYLPFERCALFSYSEMEHSSCGLYGYHFNSKAIQSIQEDIENIPIIHKGLNRLHPLKENMKSLQPIYAFEGSWDFPDKYVERFKLGSVIIAPIYVPSENKLIGAAILDQGPDSHFKVSNDTLTALTKFGQSAGELLQKFSQNNAEQLVMHTTSHPSPREIDVLKLIAEGASTSDAADQLNLSEYTVRDYISSIINKMASKNRTEAVAKAIRNGIL